MSGLRLDHLDLVVSDLDRSLAFYHVAFEARSRAEVDERFQWLRSEGAEVESEPREHDYTEGYYAVFFYDPDGIKLELVHKPGRLS